MQYQFPQNHELSTRTVQKLFNFDDGLSITDAQYRAIEVGVGKGKSMLVVSPTSTGKTLIGLLAIAESLARGANAVYLVTHRALAQQKLEDFKSQLVSDFMGGDTSNLVIATGDYIKDASGNVCSSPLAAKVLVATYEKYLAMLSASGIPRSMSETLIVCDEIQIIADETRGQNVEVLLSLLRKIGWKQFIGLSAVLDPKDAAELSNWLGVELLHAPNREKHIEYRCVSHEGVYSLNTSNQNLMQGPIAPNAGEQDTIGLVKHLIANEKNSLPIIVFCMTVKETYDLAKTLFGSDFNSRQGSLDFDDFPRTYANEFLSKTLTKRIAIHNADLTDEERSTVELRLKNKSVDVVFATTTLAAGVNFPLASAVFASFSRWDFTQKKYIPIDSAEFHNMSGRVGRMGYEGISGRVYYFSKNHFETVSALSYLDFDNLSRIKSRVTPDRFNLLALQLVASGLCGTSSEVIDLILGTFSALREEDANLRSYQQWPDRILAAIDELVQQRYVLASGNGRLVATPTGKAVGLSGLMPESCSYVLNYVCKHLNALVSYLPDQCGAGDIDRFVFLLFSAAFSSPEFVPTSGKKATRTLHYCLDRAILFNGDDYKDELSEEVWGANIKAMNATRICKDWIDGLPLRDIEELLPDLRAGSIRESIRNLSWILQGCSSVIGAASDPRAHRDLLPKAVLDANPDLVQLSKLPRVINRLVSRLALGLPDDVMWMNELNVYSDTYKLTRDEMLQFSRAGRANPEFIMQGSAEADGLRQHIFAKAKPHPNQKSNWLRDACREWKKNTRKRSARHQLKRAESCANSGLITLFYSSLGTEFEKAFERVLEHLGVRYELLDDGKQPGVPDYLVKLEGGEPIVFELKSKQNEKLVDCNGATEVLAASELYGFRDNHCVTLCHPGVDPSVPLAISQCERLTVVESHDLAEALLRLCERKLTQPQLWQWLATPGQALIDDLPMMLS